VLTSCGLMSRAKHSDSSACGPDFEIRAPVSGKWTLEKSKLALWKTHRSKEEQNRTGLGLTLVYQPAKASASTRAVAPGVRALAWQDFVSELWTLEPRGRAKRACRQKMSWQRIPQPMQTPTWLSRAVSAAILLPLTLPPQLRCGG